MSQQVGNPHAVVAQTLAQGHVAWDGHTTRGSLVFPESAGHCIDARAKQEQQYSRRCQHHSPESVRDLGSVRVNQ